MKKILVIEDEPSLRNNICEILNHFDYVTASFATGEQALAIAVEFVPHVILCDIMLPGMDGYQILEAVRKIPVLNTTAFIFLTAKASRNDLRIGMDLGADDYLTKPFSKEELLNSVNTRMARIFNLTVEEIIEHEMSDKLSSQMQNGIDHLDSVTNSERKVLYLMAEGFTSQQIADKVYLSRKTIENHRANISRKLELKGPNSLINFVFYIRGKNLIKNPGGI